MLRFFKRFFGASVEPDAVVTAPVALLPAPFVETIKLTVVDDVPPAAEPVPRKRKAAVKKPLDRDAWAEYKAPRWRQKGYERTHFKVTFQGGEVFRVSHPSDHRKPYNRGGAANVAASFYKLRMSARWANEKGLSGEVRNDKRDRYERKLKVPKVETIEVFTDANRHLMG